MSASLNGKRVVVLGGTPGIGLATAKAAQREGAMIVVASSRRQRVGQALTSLESGAEGHVVDFSDEAQVQRFFGNIGAFDHLVYTAGETLQLETLDTVRLDRARDFVNIRFWGAFMAVKYGSPHIRVGGNHLDQWRRRAAPAQGPDSRRKRLRCNGSAYPGPGRGACANSAECGLSRRSQDGPVERYDRNRS